MPTIFKLLKAIKKPKSLDLGLVGVRPEYQNTGINAVIVNGLLDYIVDTDIEFCETNLNLETNTQVMSQWKYFDARQHKRRRAYVKNIEIAEDIAQDSFMYMIINKVEYDFKYSFKTYLYTIAKSRC